MGDRGYLRPYSPPRKPGGGGGHPARNSTGFLDTHPSAYDPYYAHPRTSRDSIPARSSTDRVEGSRRYAIPRDPLPLRRNPDDYEVLPRRADSSRRAPAMPPPPDSPKHWPVVKSGGDRSSDVSLRSRPREDESYYLMPASTRSHHRTLSTGGPGDARYPVRPREFRDRLERGYDRPAREYHNTPAIRQPRDTHDRDYGYEYTDHKEQARRDLFPGPRTKSRRDSDAGPRERPASIAGVEELSKRSGRADGPPVSMRGFSKMEGNGSVRHEYRYPREPESTRSSKEDIDSPSRRRSTHEGRRDSVSLHQDRPDGYSSTTDESYKSRRNRRPEEFDRNQEPHLSRHDGGLKLDDRSRRHERRLSANLDDPRRHRHRHRDDDHDAPRATSSVRVRDKGSEREYVRRRDRGEEAENETRRYDRGGEAEHESRQRRKHDDYEDRSPDEAREERRKHHHLGEAALGSAAAAAAAAGVYARKRYDHHEGDSPATKSRSSKDDGRTGPRGSKGEIEDQRDLDDDAERERRERRRIRRQEREERERREAGGPGTEKVRDEGDEDLSRQTTLDSQSLSESRKSNEKDRRSRRHSKLPSGSDTSSGEATDSRHVSLVSPSREPEFKPKGILKNPRASFPEDPAPVREGVAPLKDAGKKGIPPNARWTKIDRRLVNPEALEFGNERFEERAEYVIVLRVLSREEIEAYTAKTAEIRESRHLEARRNETLAIEDGHHRYDEEEEERPQLALDSRPFNEPDMVIPGITDRQQASAPPIPAIVPPPIQAPGSAPLESSAAVRPEVFPTASYQRMAPNHTDGVASLAYSVPTYPVPPPLQSSPQPAQGPLPTGTPNAPYPQAQPQQPPLPFPPPATQLPPPGPAPLQPSHGGEIPQPPYPQPPGTFAHQSFPPPPPPLGTQPPPPPPQPIPQAASPPATQAAPPAPPTQNAGDTNGS